MPHYRRRRYAICVTAIVVSTAVSATGLGTFTAAAASVDPAAVRELPAAAVAAGDVLEGVASQGSLPSSSWTQLSQQILEAESSLDVFVQTRGRGALGLRTDLAAAAGSASQIDAAVEEQAEANEESASAVESALAAGDPDAEVLYTSTYSVPGFAVHAEPEALIALAERDDVVSITPIISRSIELPDQDEASSSGTSEPTNSNSNALTQAVEAWTQTNTTGRGVNVAVIDTGLDYTHAAFGGPGTSAARTGALATTSAPQRNWYDAEKYLGGWDFAGPTYNAQPGTAAYDPLPAPDANPVDGRRAGHGTHVAGTAAGYGVKDGRTFDGDYTQLTPTQVLNDFGVGPGAAPEAGIYALKVFGDNGGSTALTGAALEWIAAAMADGVQIDIVNMSLGSNFGAVDDPDSQKLTALMDAGVLPVVAAGNSGDVTSISGSPGNTARALTVAASASGRGFADAVYARTSAGGAETRYVSQFSQGFTSTFQMDLPVVRLSDPENLDGCAPLSAADRAAVVGKIVWLRWDDDDVACGSATRFDNVADAAGRAVLLESQGPAFETGIAGNARIPGAQLNSEAVEALRPALEAGTLSVRLDSTNRNAIAINDDRVRDTIASFTSRGIHGSFEDTLKPDVSAPGVSVRSAGNGTGTGATVLSGTSMATPHVAGIAALVAQARPGWDGDRIKRQVMNTAIHDVVMSPSAGTAAGTPYGPVRAGGGRVDALAAVTSQVRVEAVENGDLVSASFGVVEVADQPVTQRRTLRITNDGTTTQSYGLAYEARTSTPGVVFSLDRNTVSVEAGRSADVVLKMTIADPTSLRRTLDPTMTATQSGVTRQFATDASGVVQLINTGEGPDLRLAAHVAPKPVSDTQVMGIVFPATPAGSASNRESGVMSVTGRGLDQGEGTAGYRSLMVPLVLGAEDPDDTFAADSARATLESSDIRAVGASSTAPQLTDPSEGVLTFGVAVDGNWAVPSTVSYFKVDFDVNDDNRTDFSTYLQRRGGVDQPMAITVDAVTGRTVDERPANGLDGATGTNVFDTSVVTLPVSLRALGFTAGTTASSLTYRVQAHSFLAPSFQTDTNATLVDQSEPATIDVYNPELSFGASTEAETGEAGTSTFTDRAGALAVQRKTGSTSKALVLHLHGAAGERASVITTTTTPREPEPGSIDVGSRVTIAPPAAYGRVGASKTMTVFFAGHDGKRVTGNTIVTIRKVGTSQVITRSWPYRGMTTRVWTAAPPTTGNWRVTVTFVPDNPAYKSVTRAWSQWTTRTGQP